MIPEIVAETSSVAVQFCYLVSAKKIDETTGFKSLAFALLGTTFYLLWLFMYIITWDNSGDPFSHPSRHSQCFERSAVMMRDWLRGLTCEGSHLELHGVSRLNATAAVIQECVTVASTLHTSLACLHIGHAQLI